MSLPVTARCRGWRGTGFRATFGRRVRGYLALAVLIGLAGGVAMASVTAARRTDASYPEFLASTNPSDLVVQPFTRQAYAPGFARQLARLPHLRGVRWPCRSPRPPSPPAGNSAPCCSRTSS